MFVIAVSSVKDIFEDMKRHNSDSVENNKKVLSANQKIKRFTQDAWKHLWVGQVVKVNINEYFPADLVLLQSSNVSGIAYIETKNLDGETNLKCKEAVKETQESISDGAYASAWKARVVCEKPNDKLYKFEGTLQTELDLYPLDQNCLLLRGSSLKNTDWVYGLVVYTGHETRVMMNSSSSRIKFSNLELNMNKQIIMLFFFQVFICLIGATMSEFLTAELGPAHNDYLRVLGGSKDPKQNPALKALLKFGTWMLLFANLVPISLIVSMELVKFFQAQFIQWDITIYDRPRDLPCKVQTSNLNEQLGQVDYVFSDKTGTLTCNIMTYKKMSIGKYSYGVDKPNAPDLEEKDVTNFSMQDADFDQHLKNRRHDNYNNIINML